MKANKTRLPQVVCEGVGPTPRPKHWVYNHSSCRRCAYAVDWKQMPCCGSWQARCLQSGTIVGHLGCLRSEDPEAPNYIDFNAEDCEDYQYCTIQMLPEERDSLENPV